MARDPRRDLLGRDRDILLRDEIETLRILSETRPKRDVSTSRDRLETETSRPPTVPVLLPVGLVYIVSLRVTFKKFFARDYHTLFCCLPNINYKTGLI